MPTSARPLSPDELPAELANTVLKARSSWLSNEEILALLKSVGSVPGLIVSTEAPSRPPAGSLFIFDKKACRYFRKDGHPWETKGDGKTVNETHEKLKVDNIKILNCYYARSGVDDLKRRSYWRLDVEPGEPVYALVHYLHAEGKAGTGLQRLRQEFMEDVDSEEEQQWGRRRGPGSKSGSRDGEANAYWAGQADARLASMGLRGQQLQQGVEAEGQSHLARLSMWVQAQQAGEGNLPVPPELQQAAASFGSSGWSSGLLGAWAAQQHQMQQQQGSGMSVLAGRSAMGHGLSSLTSGFGANSQLPTPSQLSLLGLASSQPGSSFPPSLQEAMARSQQQPNDRLLAMHLQGLLQGQGHSAAQQQPGYDGPPGTAMGAGPQQQASQMDILIEEFRHEQARVEQARSEALQRPQPGPLFMSGQLVAQQLAQQQQAQQAQLAQLQNQQELAVKQAQLAQLAERRQQLEEQERQLALEVVAQLQQQSQQQEHQPQQQQQQQPAAMQHVVQVQGRPPAPAAQQLQQQHHRGLPPAPAHRQQPGGPSAAEQGHVKVEQLMQPRPGVALPPLLSLNSFGSLFKESSLQNDRALFNQISLGIREGGDFAAQLTAMFGSPDSLEVPPAAAAAAAAAAGSAGPAGDALAALLGSPQRRVLRRNSSNIPRFTSLEKDEGGLLAAQLDTDISNLPAGQSFDLPAGQGAPGSSAAIDVGPLFVTSRPPSAAAAAAISKSQGPKAEHSPAITATSQHTLEPSPQLGPEQEQQGQSMGTASKRSNSAVHRLLSSPTPSRSLTFAPPGSLDSKGAVSVGNAANGLLGPASQSESAGGVAAGIDRQGSGVSSGRGSGSSGGGSSLFRSAGQASRAQPGHAHRPHPAPFNAALAADARRSMAQEERLGAAVQAGQGARDEKLTKARRERTSQAQEADEGAMLVENPNPLARLQSFFQREAEQQTVAAEEGEQEAAAELLAKQQQPDELQQLAAVEEEAAARSLFKNMSIEEVEAVKALSSGSAGRVISLSPARLSRQTSQPPVTSREVASAD